MLYFLPHWNNFWNGHHGKILPVSWSVLVNQIESGLDGKKNYFKREDKVSNNFSNLE